jgi:hypothetical protein
MADKPKKNYANEHPKYKDDQVKPKKRLYKKSMPQKTPGEYMDYDMFSKPYRQQSV